MNLLRDDGLNSADEGAEICVPHTTRISTLLCIYAYIMASWPNLPVKSINQPRCKVLVLKYTGSMVHTLLLLQAWSVRDLHVRISHVSLMFHSILMDASKLQFQKCWVRSCLRFPMVDCYLPQSPTMRSQMCAPMQVRSCFFGAVVLDPPRGGVHGLRDSTVPYGTRSIG